MRTFKTVIPILILMSVLSGNSFAIKAKDSRGKVIELNYPPKRIVSLTPSNTEILFALGLGSRVVGVTKFCNYPPAAAKKTKVGDVSMSVEAIAKLKPDLVIAHATLQRNIIPKLEKLGIKVFTTDPDTIDQTYVAIKDVGTITSTTRKANSVVAGMKKRINSALQTSKNQKSRSVLIVVQSNPLWVSGPKTIPNEMLIKLKAKNAAHDARAGFVSFSKELAISRNPDLIVVGTKADADYFMKSAIWKYSSAVRNKRVVRINPDILFRPGPRVVDGLETLASMLKF